MPDAYATVLEAAQALDLPIDSVERRLLTLDHCDILERALEFWQFPKSFVIPVANHHQPIARTQRLGPEHAQSTMIVALADRLAHALLLGSSGNDVICPLADLVNALNVTGDALHRIEVEVVKEVANLKLLMLSRASGELWPAASELATERLSQPLCPIVIAENPEVDSVRIIFQRLSQAEPEVPSTHQSQNESSKPFNLGVIHVTRGVPLSRLVEQLDSEEKKAGCPELPLLIATAGGQAPNELLAKRRHCFVRDCIRLDRLLLTINNLLTPE